MPLVADSELNITPTLNNNYLLIGFDYTEFELLVADTHDYVVFPNSSTTDNILIENSDVDHLTLGKGKVVRNLSLFKIKGNIPTTGVELRVYRAIPLNNNSIDPLGNWYFEKTLTVANPVYTPDLPTQIAGDVVSVDLFYKVLSNLLIIQKTFGARTGVVNFTEGAVMIGNASGGITELNIPVGNMIIGGSSGAEALAPGSNGQMMGVVGGKIKWTGEPTVGSSAINRITMGYF